MNLEATIAELERTMDDCSGWTKGTGTRETLEKNGRRMQRSNKHNG